MDDDHKKPAFERDRTQDQAVSGLQVTIPERMGRRAHLPSVQVDCGLAERSGQSRASFSWRSYPDVQISRPQMSHECFALTQGVGLRNPSPLS